MSAARRRRGPSCPAGTPPRDCRRSSPGSARCRSARSARRPTRRARSCAPRSRAHGWRGRFRRWNMDFGRFAWRADRATAARCRNCSASLRGGAAYASSVEAPSFVLSRRQPRPAQTPRTQPTCFLRSTRLAPPRFLSSPLGPLRPYGTPPPPSLDERLRQNLGHVYRLSIAAVGDLVPAGGAVGHDQRVGDRPCAPPAAATVRPWPSTSRNARPRSRSCRPCRSSSTSITLTARSGHQRQRLLHGAHRAERLLVAMAVQQRRLLGSGFSSSSAGPPSSRAPGIPRTGRRCRDRLRLRAEAHREELVAQGEQARRLQADHRHALATNGSSACSRRRASLWPS